MIYRKELSRVVDHGVCPRCAEKMAWRFKCAPLAPSPVPTTNRPPTAVSVAVHAPLARDTAADVGSS
jgi:hypothetical protein